eukprot:jgi/Botrbrau1/20203/Bobra.0675s0002.1
MGASFCSLKVTKESGCGVEEHKVVKDRSVSSKELDQGSSRSLERRIYSMDIPKDAWTAILSCLGVRALLLESSAVCRSWNELSKSDLIWATRLPSEFQRKQQRFLPLWQIWLALYRTNLLADANWGNPTNSHSTWLQPKTRKREREWICTRRGRDPLFLEVPPIGVPMEVKLVLPTLDAFMQGNCHLIRTDCALATSCEWSEIAQAVDLVGHLKGLGLSRAASEHVLDSGFSLHLTLWTATRGDKEGEAMVLLTLDNAEREIPRCNARPAGARDGEAWIHDWRQDAIAHVSRELFSLDQEWRQIHLHLSALEKGSRRATVVLRGRDTNDRRGNYGPKFMAPQLRFNSS